MDPINPWIDPSETRRMAESLRGPARQPIAALEEAGFDDSFVGFSSNPTAPADQQPEPAAPSRVEHEEQEPVASCPRFAWLRERFGAVGHFIFRDDGVLACDDGGYGAYHFIARDLAHAGRDSHNVRVRILADAVLEIIPVETNGGRSWLGVVVPAALEPESVRQIHQLWLADGAGE